MAYTPATLRRIAGGIGGSGPSIWHYSNTDPHATVDDTDYFSDGKDKGMKVYDVVYVVDTDTETTTMHHVKAIDSDGNATITAATLA